MNRTDLEKLCRPGLDTLWSDIRVPGLPIRAPRSEGDTIPKDPRTIERITDQGLICYGRVVFTNAASCEIDLLASPIGADVLARRVATHLAPKATCPIKVTSSVRWTWSGPKWLGWYLGTEDLGGFSFFGENGGLLHVRDYIQVDTLDKLDPTCDERVDWGPLGSARLVDLAALALVSQHLTAQEQP